VCGPTNLPSTVAGSNSDDVSNFTANREKSKPLAVAVPWPDARIECARPHPNLTVVASQTLGKYEVHGSITKRLKDNVIVASHPGAKFKRLFVKTKTSHRYHIEEELVQHQQEAKSK
jgi:hypothetical protein